MPFLACLAALFYAHLFHPDHSISIFSLVSVWRVLLIYNHIANDHQGGEGSSFSDRTLC